MSPKPRATDLTAARAVAFPAAYSAPRSVSSAESPGFSSGFRLPAARADAAFEIASGDLVIAASAEVPLLIALGAPASAAARQQARFIVGLLGGVLAIGSSVILALIVDGTIR